MRVEHSLNSTELDITSDVDFVVPLKQVGLITRSVLEGIRLFYKPRRIVVVTAKVECAVLKQLVKLWDCGTVECVEEETFFQPNFNLSIEDLKAVYDYNRPGDQREPGWWIQQLIKLGASTQIEKLSSVYVVWDGDLVPIRRWKLCEKDVHTGRIKWYIAILQSESRSEFNSTQYSQCMKSLTGFLPLEPNHGGTFVTHHMVFHKQYVTELLNLMLKTTQSTLSWPLLIMSYSQKFYRFSEYKTYCSYMLRYHPTEFHYHDLSLFGTGGLRYREANKVMEDILTICPFSNGGLSYEQIKQYFTQTHGIDNHINHNNNNNNTTTTESQPAYVQLDHVYGLDGVDLNITSCSSNSSNSSNTDNYSAANTSRRHPFSLRVFSQLKEIESLHDLPEDLFITPMNVAVMNTNDDNISAMDDIAIQRMTIGSIWKTAFVHHLDTNRTTPRRPILHKYYYGSTEQQSQDMTAATTTSTPICTIDRSNNSSVEFSSHKRTASLLSPPSSSSSSSSYKKISTDIMTLPPSVYPYHSLVTPRSTPYHQPLNTNMTTNNIYTNSMNSTNTTTTNTITTVNGVTSLMSHNKNTAIIKPVIEPVIKVKQPWIRAV